MTLVARIPPQCSEPSRGAGRAGRIARPRCLLAGLGRPGPRPNAASLPSTGSPLHKQASGSPSSAAAVAPEKPGAKAAEVGDDFLGDLVVGERVWVNGVKPGVVQYLGETQFAPGQWAGVVLDDPVGKNDGAVGGVRYFECPALQGIFTRPSKLTRQPTAEGSGSDAHSVESLTAQNLSLHSGTATPPLTSRVIPLREGVLNSSVKTGNESGSNLSDSGSVKRGDKDLRLGDRVLVSTGGTRLGRSLQRGELEGGVGEGPGGVQARACPHQHHTKGQADRSGGLWRLAVWPWVSISTSLSLSLPIYTMAILIVPDWKLETLLLPCIHAVTAAPRKYWPLLTLSLGPACHLRRPTHAQEKAGHRVLPAPAQGQVVSVAAGGGPQSGLLQVSTSGQL